MNDTALDLRIDGPAAAPWTVVLAHGAGAGMEAAFLVFCARELARAGLRCIRFEFPYMRRMRAEGRRRAPDREPVLRATFAAVVAQVRADAAPGMRLAIGGKSMGGRMASLVAQELAVDALWCLGYPFHPPGQPTRLRTAHLAEFSVPALICQGTCDPFGTYEEVGGYSLAPSIRLHWLEGAGHDLAKARSGAARDAEWGNCVAAGVQFLRSI